MTIHPLIYEHSSIHLWPFIHPTNPSIHQFIQQSTHQTIPQTIHSSINLYVSIHFSYDLKRDLALFYWTKRLVHYYQGFEWAACLDYAIAYFMKYQNASPEAWYSIDSKLVMKYFMNAKWNTFTAPHQHSQSSSKKSYEERNFTSTNIDICQNWNYLVIECKYKTRFDEDVCGRRHVCFTCHEHDHKTYECLTKSKPFNWFSWHCIISSSSSLSFLSLFLSTPFCIESHISFHSLFLTNLLMHQYLVVMFSMFLLLLHSSQFLIF